MSCIVVESLHIPVIMISAYLKSIIGEYIDIGYLTGMEYHTTRILHAGNTMSGSIASAP